MSTSRTDLALEWARLSEEAPSVALDGLLPDLTVHLFDLLGVRGDRSHRDQPLVSEALRFWSAQVDALMHTVGHRGLRLELTDDPTSVGVDDDEVVLSGSAFELLRTITGRRSLTQVDSLAPASVVALVALYGWRATPLDE